MCMAIWRRKLYYNNGGPIKVEIITEDTEDEVVSEDDEQEEIITEQSSE